MSYHRKDPNVGFNLTPSRDSLHNENRSVLGWMPAVLPNRFRRVPAFIALILVIVLARGVVAQLSTASVSGTVRDQTAALVQGATVKAIQISTGVVTTTTANSDGIFVFSTLPVGSYSIEVSAPGFQAFQTTGVTLTVGQHLTLDIPLKVGTSDQVITVTSAAVSVDSTTPTEQSIIEEKIVRDLPLNGRNPASLIFTVAGATDATLNISGINSASSAVREGDVNTPAASAPSVHGARPGGTYFSLDGASNTDPFSVIGGPFPNPDATGEFNVVTGTYGAQYVSAPGGAVNIVSRSGTNQIHGTVFEFIRNGYVNARNRFSPTPDVLKRNQFGFALGGPIVHDKLFFFAAYQATPITSSHTSAGYFPTALQRQGNFGTFTIPQSMLSPAIQKALPYIPVGAPGSGLLNYVVPDRSTDQQALAKIDYNIAKHHLFARGFYDRFVAQASRADGPYLSAGEENGYIMPWQTLAAGDNWTLGSFSLQTTASYLRALANTVKPPQTFGFNTLGINNLVGTTTDPGFSLFYVLNQFSVGNNSASRFPRDSLEISQNAFLIKGQHQLSFGLNYRHIALNETNPTGQNPVAVFVGADSYIYGLLGIIPGATFNPVADFMLGAPYVFLQQDGFYANIKGNLFGVFAEDSYKLSKKLTLTAGLRWDPYLPYTPQHGHVACFIPGAKSTVFTNALVGLVFPGDPGCSSTGQSSSIAQFQPRVGLAYQFGNSGTTVFRAGYGKYDLQFPLNAYYGFSEQPFVRSIQSSQPFISIDNVYATLGFPDPFTSGFQDGSFVPSKNIAFVTGSNAATFSPNFHPGYIQQWSFSLQQLLTSTDSVDIAYVGTEGTHLGMGVGLNTPVYGPGADTTNEQARRPYQQFTNINQLSSIGTSSYNGVDITYRHRTRSFAVTSAFTWGKALDDASQPIETGQLNLPNGNNHLFRGRSDFDQNFLFRNTFTYSSPDLKNMNLFARSLLGSWMASGVLIMDAGTPFSVMDGDDNSYTGTSLDLADRVPGVPLYANGILNYKAFTDNAPGTFGNSGRNAYRAPSYKDVDIALMKQIPIRKEFSGTFRVEAFNIFNHPNLLPPASAYGQPGTAAALSFGTFNGARDPRILQASIKLSF